MVASISILSKLRTVCSLSKYFGFPSAVFFFFFGGNEKERGGKQKKERKKPIKVRSRKYTATYGSPGGDSLRRAAL